MGGGKAKAIVGLGLSDGKGKGGLSFFLRFTHQPQMVLVEPIHNAVELS